MKPTPVMSQYLHLKQEAGDAILFFRMGDFYEMFLDDAILAAELLDLTLTSRDKNAEDPVPMAGVPWHSAGAYAARLLKLGRRVAICEQKEPAEGRGLMEREIVEILTPGTAVVEGLPEDEANVYLAAIDVRAESWGIAAADISTGEFLAGELSPEAALTEIERLGPREVLLARETAREPVLARFLREHPEIFPALLDDWHFSRRRGEEFLGKQFGASSLEAFGLAALPRALAASGALLSYAQEQRRSPLRHLRAPRLLGAERGLMLDESTLRNLEVLAPLGGGGKHCLLKVLDATLTPMGARALRGALARPPADPVEIAARHEAVARLLASPEPLEALRGALRGIADLERLLARLHCGRGRPQDLGRLRDSLARLPSLIEAAAAVERKAGEGQPADVLADGAQPARLPADPDAERAAPSDPFPFASGSEALLALAGELDRAIADGPELAAEEGAVRAGYDARLDELRALGREGAVWFADLQERERRATGIPSLKVGSNKVFGYYLEVTRAHLSRVPERFERRQTLVGAERFVTPELKEWEEKITTAREDARAREAEILAGLIERVTAATAELQALASAIGRCDLLAAFAVRAREYRYVRPRIDESDRIEIRGGRHPVVERFLQAEGFVANDIDLDARERQIQILTGPNMAGKSTFLRQTGLIVLMAQAGSFVPAEEARLGVVDRVFTRVGASDNIARGQSTFLVEMIETSRILHAATSRSLVLLDEIGRGTSTFDGLAIAWAVAEHLRRDPLRRPRTIFATHFHELTALARQRAGYVNLSMLVKEWKDEVVFVRRVVPGAADRSYGIHVARLAGLPEEVLERARTLLSEIERHGPRTLLGDGAPEDGPQMALFAGTPGKEAAYTSPREAATSGPERRGTAPAGAKTEPVGWEVARALERLDLERMTGIEALGWLAEWRRRLAPGAEAAEGAPADGGDR